MIILVNNDKDSSCDNISQYISLKYLKILPATLIDIRLTTLIAEIDIFIENAAYMFCRFRNLL